VAATNNKAEYAASASVTATGLASLATSSTLVAGYSLAEIDNTTNKYFDEWISGKFTVGTTPTANTVVEVWVIPKREDSSYHDTFDGTAKAVTVTNRDMLLAYGKLLAQMTVPVTTSNVGYEFAGSVLDACRSFAMPAKYQLFFVHNTGVNANSTGSNFSVYRKGLYSSSGN
jgi:hypothetical protein